MKFLILLLSFLYSVSSVSWIYGGKETNETISEETDKET